MKRLEVIGFGLVGVAMALIVIELIRSPPRCTFHFFDNVVLAAVPVLGTAAFVLFVVAKPRLISRRALAALGLLILLYLVNADGIAGNCLN